MMHEANRTSRLGIDRSSLPLLLVLVDAFLWYYLTLNIMSNISNTFQIDLLLLLPLHALGAIVSGILGVAFSRPRRRLLLLWTTLGAVTALLPLLDTLHTLLGFQLICFAWGFSFGLGMPACLSYFAENVAIERRGLFGGLVFLSSFFCAFVINGVTRSGGLQITYMPFGILRLVGFIPLLTLDFEKKEAKPERDVRHYVSAIVHDRRIFMYLTPWFLFNVIDKVEELLLRSHVKNAFPQYSPTMQLMSLLFTGTFVFVGGIFCDLVGRKTVTILGFSVLGVAYAIISIVPNALGAWYFFFVINGLSWGLFYTIFVTLIWGDLAPKGLEEAYYYIGNIPLFLAAILQTFLAGPMTFLSEASAFSLAAFFLFIAVLPILFAPETLPEKKIQERQVRDYVEKAKKLRGKHV